MYENAMAAAVDLKGNKAYNLIRSLRCLLRGSTSFRRALYPLVFIWVAA